MNRDDTERPALDALDLEVTDGIDDVDALARMGLRRRWAELGARAGRLAEWTELFLVAAEPAAVRSRAPRPLCAVSVEAWRNPATRAARGPLASLVGARLRVALERGRTVEGRLVAVEGAALVLVVGARGRRQRVSFDVAGAVLLLAADGGPHDWQGGVAALEVNAGSLDASDLATGPSCASKARASSPRDRGR